MTFPLPPKKAGAFALAFLLLTLAIVTYTNSWWPGIMLAIGLPIALKQALLGKYMDMAISLVIFVGVFISVHFALSGKIIASALLMGGAIYIFFKELSAEKKKDQ